MSLVRMVATWPNPLLPANVVCFCLNECEMGPLSGIARSGMRMDGSD